ncbi:M15 family metallopeptidase [Pseudoponticoccus marisrubri]|uniref:Cytosolic protein n=1 Tax=Pseudoponticoccus marisrubri TaxID=1685382 RepID=A0A0W7WNX1_9RHOB|nr:M15 family metallopeptidase [Pseudoponticoccus marisrubri]KUF12252.1 cytosolic protein [Pseudoponticoccus marisrubri]
MRAFLFLCLAWPGLAPAGETGTVSEIPDAMWARMEGVSWHADLDCPAREALRLLDIPYTDFAGVAQSGQMIVAASHAEEVLEIFAEARAGGFRIARMQPVHMFFGKDDLSMQANNTSAFNCRLTTSGSRLSDHAFGTAIDINPVQNPFVTRTKTLPEAGAAYDSAEERAAGQMGVLVPGDAMITAFKARGWGWGGDWRSLKDYQHFSVSGR